MARRRTARDRRKPTGAAGWAHRAVLLCLVLGSFVQRPGRTTFDTKLDMAEDPDGFLERALHMWNPQAAFGEVQNQAYGYFFPQGLFFLLGDLGGLPAWVIQRAWTALLLVLAYEGVRRLTRAVMPKSSAAAHVLAGLAYALAPRLITVSATISGEALPTVFVPWMLLPLVLCRRGHLTPRVAALLSGCALLCISGMNAAGVIAVLPLPLLLLATGLRLQAGRRLAGWWCVASAFACAWWLMPLLLLGRYSPPFLDYIETSSATTGPLTWFNALRGADHWVGYAVVGGEPWWPAGYLLSVTAAGLLITALVAAVGVWGLTRSDLPLRAVWNASFLIGLTCLVAGHAGDLASPLADHVRALLNGPLAPLRNVHKVDPLVRLPLALGVGHACQLILAGWWRRERSWRPVAVVTVGLLVAAGAFPIIGGDFRKPGWAEIPEAWAETATQVEAVHGEGRVLILPGSGTAEQVWGSTIDEPMQVLSNVPWAVRNQIPLAPGPTIRLLDSIEDLVSAGLGSDGLAPLLARTGVSTVVLRHDLKPAATDAPAPLLVAQSLEASDHITLVSRHGSMPAGGPMTEVFTVDLPVDRVAVEDTSDLVQMAGGPEDLLPALETGILPATSPVIFGAGPDIQGDGYQLVERRYGQVHNARSSVRSPDDPIRSQNRATDYAGVPGQQLVVREHAELVAVAASSSIGFVDSFVGAVQAHGPYAALDGDDQTTWRTDPFSSSGSEWIELRLREPRAVAGVRIALDLDEGNVEVRSVVVDTGRQRRKVEIDAATGEIEVELNRSPTEKIRIEFAKGGGLIGSVAVREVEFPGFRADQTLRLPDAGADGETAFLFTSAPPQRPCLSTGTGPTCDKDRFTPPGGGTGIDRNFTTTERGRRVVSGTVVALPGKHTQRLLEPLSDDQVRVRSSSSFAGDPLSAPQLAMDDRIDTAWLTNPGDDNATLRLAWGPKRTVSRIQLNSAHGARRPTHAVVTAGDEVREVDLRGGMGFFDPIRTNRLNITLSAPANVGGEQPIGVAELILDGLDDLVWSPERDMATGAICGYGPPVTIDGVEIQTRVVGKINDLRGLTMRWEACGEGADGIDLRAGEHRLRAQPTGQWAPVTLALAPETGATTASSGDSRAVEVVRWDATDRQVRVTDGGEAVLRIPENSNVGWEATLDGRVLETVDVDGWQQGYLLPAGSGGTVTLEFVPDRIYRTSMFAGGALALFLLLWTLFSLRTDRMRREGPWSVAARSEVTTVTAGIRGRPRAGWLVIGGAAVVGGPAPALGALVGLLCASRLLPAVTAGATALAAFVGWAIASGTLGDETFGLLPVWLAGGAVGAVAVNVMLLDRPRRGRHRN